MGRELAGSWAGVEKVAGDRGFRPAGAFWVVRRNMGNILPRDAALPLYGAGAKGGGGRMGQRGSRLEDGVRGEEVRGWGKEGGGGKMGQRERR